MKFRIIVLGTASTFVLMICAGALLLLGIGGELFSGPEVSAKPVRIAQVAPLKAQVPVPSRPDAKSPPGLVAASVEQSLPPKALPTATATASPIPPASPTVTPPPNVTPRPSATAIPAIEKRGVATRLVIPKLSLDSPVLFAPVQNGTWVVDHLYQAVGHLEGTAPPGSSSNMVLAGHVTLDVGVYGPFANLGYLAPGDLVIVYEGEKEFLYLVNSRQTVDRRNVDVVYPSEVGELTLITCVNWSSEENRYTDRLVIKGRLIKG